MKKIIFMGTPEFSVNPLVALNDCDEIEIGFVITGEDKKRGRNQFLPTPVKTKALELGIPTFEPKSVNSRESLDKIHEYNPDYIVVIAYGQLIKDEILNTYKDRIINIHSSLLPKYRGAAPMQWTLLNKDKIAGVSSMLIEKTMDTGDVLDVRKIEIDSYTSINTLHDRLSELSGELIVDTILNFDVKYKNRQKQDESLATYSQKITKEMGHINFSSNAEDILATIMAFSSWPSTYVYYYDEVMKIHNISIIEKYNNEKVGTIFKADKDGIFVNCNDKCIVIEEIQMPGKKRMLVRDYLLGNKIKVGTIFN